MQQIPITIRDEIESVNFPSLPHALLRFLKVVEDDRASMSELSALVAMDPALSARFLTVANSAALRRDKEIKSIEQCMVTLGTRLARTLAACLVVQSVFARSAGEKQYDFKGFWGHSLRVAEMSRAIAEKTGSGDAEEAYIAGLLHDVGLLLLLGSEGDRYGDLLQRSIDESVLSDVERPMIGTDHSAVGAWLIDQWKLSSFMSDAILFHHKPSIEIVDADQLSQIVWSSHILSAYNERLDLTQIAQTPDVAAVLSMLAIDIQDIAAIRDQTSEHVAIIAEALGIAKDAERRILPAPLVSLDACRLRQNGADPIDSHMDAMVRDLALTHALQQNLSSLCSEEDIYIAIKESAKILFSLGRLAFLIVDPANGTLSGANFSGQSALLKRLAIRLDPVSSLAAAVVSGEQPYATFDNDRPSAVSLVDVQIAHALNSEGVLYVPMRIGNRCIGLMVYGISVPQHARIQKNLPWMTHFSHLAANSIDSWREMRGNEELIEANVTDRFKQHTRRVVHEAGNPLAIIKNYLKIVSHKIPEETGVREELDILREEIDRVSTILRRLNTQGDAPAPTGTVDINGVIEGMLSLYAGSLFLTCGITVETTLEPSLPPIPGDRDSFKQILLNIWKNAAEAMPNGGGVGIATKKSVTLSGQPCIEIVLSDSGPGLPPDVVKRLFKPLEQNRRPGHSGIGLSIVAGLVEKLGGVITCQSFPGFGTSFKVQLPLTDGKLQ